MYLYLTKCSSNNRGLFHECLACKASPMDLNKYSEHITSDKHLAKLKSLMEAHAKPISLLKILGQERLLQIRQRNRTLRKEA